MVKRKPFLVNHEVPVDLLYESRQFCDYDFCLPHLLDHNKQYKEYFYNSKRAGRYIIMDNSLHELGSAYDNERLLYWINELEPNEFIVPDVWENSNNTLRNSLEWKQIQRDKLIPKSVKLIAVAQGETPDKMLFCLHVLATYQGYEKVALSYGASSYNTLFPHPNPYVGRMLGRVQFVSKLVTKDWFKETKLHLLGCSLPQEFQYYNNPEFSFIESIDTSNPVVHGILGVEYKEYGLNNKLSKKIDTITETKNKELVFKNIDKFNQFLNYEH